MGQKIRITGGVLIFIILIGMFVSMGVVQHNNVGDVKKLTAGKVSYTAADLSWKSVSGADGYNIYRRAKGDDEFVLDRTVDADKSGTVNARVTKLEQATAYDFYITAFKQHKKSKIESEERANISICTVPAPQTIGVASPDAGQLLINWTNNERAKGYKLQYVNGDGSDFSNAETVDIEENAINTKSFENLTIGDTYSVRVCSYISYKNEIVAGNWSEVKSIKISEKIEMSGDIDPSRPMIALTFDDGPGYNSASDKILDVLEKYNARATFFMVGKNAADHPDNVKRKVELGCEIGNHTYNHNHYGSNVTTSDIKKSSDAIYKAGGVYPTAFRSPGGNTTNLIRKECKSEGMVLYYWSLDTQDWKYRDANKVYKKVMNHVEDGDIILMHEIYGSTADAVEKMVPKLIEKGYQLVTCEELVQAKTGKKPVPGQQYVNATIIKNQTS